MRPYEVVYILRPELSDEEIQETVDRFAQLVKEYDGVVEKTERWGKRRLAYEIDRCNDGHYVLMNYQGGATLNDELDRRMKLHEGVLRHLVVARSEAKSEEPESQDTPDAPVQAADPDAEQATAEAEEASAPNADEANAAGTVDAVDDQVADEAAEGQEA